MIIALSVVGTAFFPVVGHLAVGFIFGWHTLGIVVAIQFVLGILFGR